MARGPLTVGLTIARRTWNVERNGRTYVVEMEDEYFLGRRVVRINGDVVHTGRQLLSDHSGAYQFDLGGEPAFLKISTNGFRYYYELVTQSTLAATSWDKKDLAQEPPNLAATAGLTLFALAMAAILVWLADGRLWREPAVAAAGVPVDAIVTGAETTNRDARRIAYRFDVGTRSFTHEGYISRERYERALDRGVVSVRYLGIAPQVNAFDPEASDVIFDVVLGLALAGTSASFIFSAAQNLRAYHLWSRLSTTGVETIGRVTRVRTIRNRYMLATGCYFEYSYAAGSEEHRGRSGEFVLDAAMRYPVGGPVRIRHDPDRPGDSIMVTPDREHGRA